MGHSDLVSAHGIRFKAMGRSIVLRTSGGPGPPRVCPYNSAALLGAFVTSTTSDRNLRRDPWADDIDDCGRAPFKALTREEVRVLVANNPRRVSPWWVIAAQVVVGVLTALVAGWFGSAEGWFWSALYGAAVVVVPGALMARGMTSPLTSVSPGASALGVMLWSMVKIAVSVVLLMLAPKLVQPLSWPALLATMVLCMQVYWVALLWRRR
jgi:ATP synthase protein I